MEKRLERFLRDKYPSARSVQVEGFRVVAGGYSQETFACDCRIEHGQRGPEELKLILRRDPPPQTDILPTSRAREHLLLGQVTGHTSIPVPRSLFLDETGAFFKRPTMVMERVPGSSNLSALFGGADAGQLESVATHLCECLAELHTTSIVKLDPHGALADPRGAGIDASSWDSYMASMLAYFKSNYASIAFDPLPVFYDAYTSLQNRLPAPVPLVVCHGDFQTSNFLYKDGRVTGIIDWENAHIGDPREDLGWMYHMQIIMQTDLMGAVKADGGFLQHYTKLTGIPVNMDDVRFFQVFTASALSAPILSAIRRRLEGANSEFLHLYILQSLVASMPVYTRILGYPAAEVAS